MNTQMEHAKHAASLKEHLWSSKTEALPSEQSHEWSHIKCVKMSPWIGVGRSFQQGLRQLFPSNNSRCLCRSMHTRVRVVNVFMCILGFQAGYVTKMLWEVFVLRRNTAI